MAAVSVPSLHTAVASPCITYPWSQENVTEFPCTAVVGVTAPFAGSEAEQSE